MLRNIAKAGLNAGLGLLFIIPAGCRVDVYSPPPREVVVEQGPPGDDVVVEQAPPEVEVYEAVPPPRDGYWWIRGHYVLIHGRYEWRRDERLSSGADGDARQLRCDL